VELFAASVDSGVGKTVDDQKHAGRDQQFFLILIFYACQLQHQTWMR